MNGPVPPARPFRLIVDDSSTRLLGLTVPERNRRVARRCGAVETADADAVPTLTLPPRIAVTPALIRSLPEPVGIIHIRSSATALPIIWSAPGADAHLAPRLMEAPAGSVLDVSTPAARHQASWLLLRASGKPADGWLARHLHRKISRLFSYLFLYVGLTANMATFATFLLGATGAWFVGQTSHLSLILGTLLYWGSSIADGIDGEMARLTMSESAFGEQLDTGVDQATHMLALAGVGVGWWRQGMDTPAIILAVATAVGVPAVLLWAMALVRRAKQSSHFFVVTKPIELAIERAARDTGALPLRAAAIIFILFRREALSCSAFLVSLVTSQRVVYPVLVAISLAIIASTFVIYRKPLDEALVQVA